MGTEERLPSGKLIAISRSSVSVKGGRFRLLAIKIWQHVSSDSFNHWAQGDSPSGIPLWHFPQNFPLSSHGLVAASGPF